MKIRCTLILLFVVAVTISGCLTYQKVSNGVVVTVDEIEGIKGGEGTITNANNFNVTIKAVFISPHGGEQTRWIKEFSPGETWKAYTMNTNFYISRNGTEIGYI